MSSVGDQIGMDLLLDALKGKDISNLTIIFGTCEDCEHWDKDNEYCNHLTTTMDWSEDEYYKVYTDKDFCCKDFKKRGDVDG